MISHININGTIYNISDKKFIMNGIEYELFTYDNKLYYISKNKEINNNLLLQSPCFTDKNLAINLSTILPDKDIIYNQYNNLSNNIVQRIENSNEFILKIQPKYRYIKIQFLHNNSIYDPSFLSNIKWSINNISYTDPINVSNKTLFFDTLFNTDPFYLKFTIPQDLPGLLIDLKTSIISTYSIYTQKLFSICYEHYKNGSIINVDYNDYNITPSYIGGFISNTYTLNKITSANFNDGENQIIIDPDLPIEDQLVQVKVYKPTNTSDVVFDSNITLINPIIGNSYMYYKFPSNNGNILYKMTFKVFDSSGLITSGNIANLKIQNLNTKSSSIIVYKTGTIQNQNSIVATGKRISSNSFLLNVIGSMAGEIYEIPEPEPETNSSDEFYSYYKNFYKRRYIYNYNLLLLTIKKY